MENVKLINLTMKDGSRHFLSLPEHQYFTNFCNYLKKHPGIRVTDYVSDHVTEVWMDFTFCGYDFSVNNQAGAYWFFVKDPKCPEDVLCEVANYCRPFLSKDRKPEKAIIDPNYDIKDFGHDLFSGSLRWFATIMAVVNLLFLLYLVFDPEPPEVHFPFHLKGKSAFVLLFISLGIWTVLSIVNWRNHKSKG